ncbi:hypothetical protein BS17DRAFT_769875 [Gyrodon lividus]|nr:hypothetical protein BS17DRAFT_769875 [Gyrodon lividus]
MIPESRLEMLTSEWTPDHLSQDGVCAWAKKVVSKFGRQNVEQQPEAGPSLLSKTGKRKVNEVPEILCDLELTEAISLLESATEMLKHRREFTVVEFHLRRVQALGKGKGYGELDLHVDFLMQWSLMESESQLYGGHIDALGVEGRKNGRTVT